MKPDSAGFREVGWLLLTDKTTLFLEKDKEGKFQVKTASWDQNETFLPGEQLRIEVVSSAQVALTRWHSETAKAALQPIEPVD
jgi:hypothetical protein